MYDSSEYGFELLSNVHESEISGMGAIDSAGVLKGAAEDTFAVHKIDIFITVVDGVVIGVNNDSSAADRVLVSSFAIGIEIRAGHHNDRNIGMRCSDLVIDLSVSILKMLYVRSVVIVVEYECRHIESRHIVDDRILSLAAA